jgi:cytochrome c biogenesis protein CcmG, thiol:disulfide interchange protein DsbE
MPRVLVLLGAVALVAVVIVGLGQAGGNDDGGTPAPEFDLETARQQLEGAPPPLAGLHEQSNQILEGGVPAFEARLAELEGTPIVINKWASWCRPCRAEFPIFQQVATDHGKEIAFLGVNGTDKRPAAEKFLAERPLPYPSYEDPDEEISQELKVPKNYPMTIFIDAQGKTFRKAGEYATREELENDIEQYLGT